jgi:hypothetical protein
MHDAQRTFGEFGLAGGGHAATVHGCDTNMPMPARVASATRP